MKLNSELQEVMAAILSIPLSDVTAELAAGDVDTWDSLGHLKLILSLEENFKVKFRTDQIPELLTVKQIQEELEARGVFSSGS